MADTREVTATLVVNFGAATAEDGDGLFVEVDTRPNGLNSGRSSFQPGDTVYLLLYKTDNIEITSVVSSHGVVEPWLSVGDQTVDQEDDLQFIDETEKTLSRPCSTLQSFTWLGKVLGSPTLRDQMTVAIPTPADEHYAGVLRTEYKSKAIAYRLSSTFLNFDEYPIVVHFNGVAS